MRTIPVDPRSIRFVATGNQPSPVYRYVDGERAGQDTTDDGQPLVRVALLVEVDGEVQELAVKVPDDPTLAKLNRFGEVTVRDLTVTPYVRAGRVALSASAVAITAAGRKSDAS